MTYIVTENRKKYNYMDPECVPFGSDLSRRDSVRMRSRITVGDLQVVTRTALFRGLKPETVERIIGPATAVLLHPHERAARQDQPATSFFVVIEGWLKVYRNSASGAETVINVLKKGESYAEAVALTGQTYPACAEAATDVRLVKIPADHIVHCIRENPEIALPMIASACQWLAKLVQQVEHLKTHSGVQRLAEFITSLTSIQNGSCIAELPYDKIIIASRLGLSSEYLSRAFARLRTIGVVVKGSQVSVRDIAQLRNFAVVDRKIAREERSNRCNAGSQR